MFFFSSRSSFIPQLTFQFFLSFINHSTIIHQSFINHSQSFSLNHDSTWECSSNCLLWWQWVAAFVLPRIRSPEMSSLCLSFLSSLDADSDSTYQPLVTAWQWVLSKKRVSLSTWTHWALTIFRFHHAMNFLSHRQRKTVASTISGKTQTSSEGSWYTNVALLSRAIDSGGKTKTNNVKTGQPTTENEEKSKMKEEIESEMRKDESECCLNQSNGIHASFLKGLTSFSLSLQSVKSFSTKAESELTWIILVMSFKELLD